MTGNEHFEHAPNPRPELGAYLEAHQDIDPATVLVAGHIPPLIGGIKSKQFVIRDPEADADTPPQPDAHIDLGKVVVAASEMKGFADFFTGTEAQADKQYDVALLETRQALAEAAERDIDVKVLFVPDTVNSSASGYFTRLTRLAQDTGVAVAMRQVDYDDGDAFESFKRFEPVKAAGVDEYWQERADNLSYPLDPAIHLSTYAFYTMENAYEQSGPPTAELVDSIALPIAKEPLVFTSFEQLQKDYPGAPISDPTLWDKHKEYYTLVTSDQEANQMRRAKQIERDTLRQTMRTVARATTSEIWELFDEKGGTHHGKLATIREIANSTNENNDSARMILAKLGDRDAAQTILAEIRDRTSKNAGYESLTIAPLGIHMRHDELLFGAVLKEVQTTIEHGDIEDSDTLLSLMGALFHSHDPRVGELLAGYLTVPTQNTQAYASKVLHAMSRWMPEYAMGLAYKPSTEQRDRSFQAIETQTVAFLDAYNKGELDGIYEYMFYRPNYLAPLLFWFGNSQHRQVATDYVMREFKDNGQVITDHSFERTYLTYRKQFGDLPEISKFIRTT
jgi:hypothetical protein